LSYAEVKAIASGNPAVLTLAEADAELQRLAVLKKQHTDAQYLARVKQRDLPGTIKRLEQRIEGLTQDIATAKAHAGEPIVIGERRYHDKEAVEALAIRLKSVPEAVSHNRSFPLSQYHGLRFGLFLTPQGHDVCVEGAVTRMDRLYKDHFGPRVVLNAVDRIIEAYDAERIRAGNDLAIARNQLRDYAARIDTPFQHGAYIEELTELRQQLKAALANPAGKGEEIGSLAERTKALKASQTIEAAAERKSPRSNTATESVTARLRQRLQAAPTPTPEPEEKPLVPVTVAAPPPPPAPAAPFRTSQPSLFLELRPRPEKPKPSHQQQVSHEQKAPAGQLSLF